jgi:hemoglobin
MPVRITASPSAPNSRSQGAQVEAYRVTTPYERIGGEAGVRAFTRRFYALMDTLPEAAAARAIHGASVEGAERKLFEYLTGWLGGPPLFTDKYGPPMLRRRHLHASIGQAEIDGWLACFRQAWAETIAAQEVSTIVCPQIEALAQHMRNREP